MGSGASRMWTGAHMGSQSLQVEDLGIEPSCRAWLWWMCLTRDCSFWVGGHWPSWWLVRRVLFAVIEMAGTLGDTGLFRCDSRLNMPWSLCWTSLDTSLSLCFYATILPFFSPSLCFKVASWSFWAFPAPIDILHVQYCLGVCFSENLDYHNSQHAFDCSVLPWEFGVVGTAPMIV